MIKKIQYSIASIIFIVSANLNGAELINESSFERLRSLPYEEYDSGYGLWDSSDIELFISQDENFSIGLWKSKAGSEEINTPYPYNVFFMLKSGEIKTKTTSGITNTFVRDEGFLIPKGWMGTFEISSDVEAIYFYDGLIETINDPTRDIIKDSGVHYGSEEILLTMAMKEFSNGENGLMTKEQQTFNNLDESFSMGVWESSKANIPSDWSYDEFMYVIKGQIVMTDNSGKVYEINPGEGIIVPTGWEGDFVVPDGVVKIWAIYDPS
jgi:uncharacterized cupin superfamily protein